MFPMEREPYLATVIVSWILTFWTIVSLYLVAGSGFVGIKSHWSHVALSSSSTAPMINLHPQDQTNISCARFEKIMVEHKYEARKPDWVRVSQKQHAVHRAETAMVHRWKRCQMDPTLIDMHDPKDKNCDVQDRKNCFVLSSPKENGHWALLGAKRELLLDQIQAPTGPIQRRTSRAFFS